MLTRTILFSILLLSGAPEVARNFSNGVGEACLYGIHEITLKAARLPDIPERYSTFPRVSFNNGETTIDVPAFYDGDGNGGEGDLWKARLYVNKTGTWSWAVTEKAGLRLKGTTGGSFDATDRNPELSGKLRQHTGNPNRWATERKPRLAFLGLGDTQYTLMDKVWTTEPNPEKGGAGDWDAVIDDSYENGATLIRAGAFGGYSRWDGTTTVGPPPMGTRMFTTWSSWAQQMPA
jgi:hypothetical protein